MLVWQSVGVAGAGVAGLGLQGLHGGACLMPVLALSGLHLRHRLSVAPATLIDPEARSRLTTKTTQLPSDLISLDAASTKRPVDPE